MYRIFTVVFMAEQSYINFNGNIIDASEPVFTSANRAFRYGDGIFETIRLMNDEILFFDRHLKRLKDSMNLLGMTDHEDLTFHNLYLSIRHLDQVNRLKGNGRIRLEVFRNDGGLYTPQSNNVSYVIEATALKSTAYSLNQNGLKIDIYSEIRKPVSRLSNLKSSNALYYVMAGLYKKNTGTGDCLVLNTGGRIAEAISSNIFIVMDEKVITPSLTEACVAGVMRDVIIEKLLDQGIHVVEGGITPEDLNAAGEVFLTDVINGIRWVGAFRNKRYFSNLSRSLISDLKESQIKKA